MMTDGMTFRGGLTSLPDRAILSARLTFCDVKVWGNVPNRDRICVTLNSWTTMTNCIWRRLGII